MRSNADLLDSFGYNSIELDDIWFLLGQLEKVGVTRENLSQTIIAVANQLHQNGQTFSLMVYCSSVKDFKTGKEYTVPGSLLE